MKDLLNTENLIELHEKLNEFAKYHQNKGGQEAHKLVKQLWDEIKENPRDVSHDCLKYDAGFEAFKIILNELHRKFFS